MDTSLARKIDFFPVGVGVGAREAAAVIEKVFPIISPERGRIREKAVSRGQIHEFIKVLEHRARRTTKLVLPHLSKAVQDGLEVTFFGISMAVAMGSLWLLGTV